ncbi:hypothetical protein DIURU_004004 [Diutina rugosa]|uniref:Uncharacterized protein n=1 Tax=Diutina rugosa TaxID=5481 RepID=A0A642UL26_DIURU|nr:uncharacterized protein DIURU_004004 [Diutina rugosa]KAA8899963.1 hypothetical protein DIURU_004004 [Diutina rugosa]
MSFTTTNSDKYTSKSPTMKQETPISPPPFTSQNPKLEPASEPVPPVQHSSTASKTDQKRPFKSGIGSIDAPLEAPKTTSGQCTGCGRYIRKNLARHMNTHRGGQRWPFVCKFRALGKCSKMAKFPTFFKCKLHMLNHHFRFDDRHSSRDVKHTDRLKLTGKCECGYHCVAEEWFNGHVLTFEKTCPFIPNPRFMSMPRVHLKK